jgi:hypothetical protein
VDPIRTRLRRYSRNNVSGTESDPSGPNAGFLCEEWAEGLLRIRAKTIGTTYNLKIWSFENEGGNDWFEDPSERRSVPAGQDYTRGFWTGPVDRMAVQLDVTAGSVDVFWTFS